MQRHNFLSMIFQKCLFGEVIPGNPWGLAMFTGGQLCRGLFFKNVAGFRPSVCNFIKGQALVWVLSCGFSEAFKGVFLTEHLQKTASQIFHVFINFRKKSIFCFYQSILIDYYKSHYQRLAFIEIFLLLLEDLKLNCYQYCYCFYKSFA